MTGSDDGGLEEIGESAQATQQASQVEIEARC